MNRTISNPEDTKHLPENLVGFVRRQIVSAAYYELRRDGRHPMMLPVRAVSVDEDNQPIGSELDLVTRDISSTGIGLVHTDNIDANRMALQFSLSGTEVNLVIDVDWSGPLGPFFGAGGTFIVKLDEFPVAH